MLSTFGGSPFRNHPSVAARRKRDWKIVGHSVQNEDGDTQTTENRIDLSTDKSPTVDCFSKMKWAALSCFGYAEPYDTLLNRAL